MIPIPSGVRVWLATGYTDMRCGFPSLALRVQEVLSMTRWVATCSASEASAAIWSRSFGTMVRVPACLRKSWNEEGSFGLRPKVARWQSRRHSFPTCSPELIGARRRKLGDQREYDCI